MAEAESTAVRAVVDGKVQAVGFRDAVRRRAVELGLTGWVRNEDDGSVRVHAEGEPGAVEEILAFLREGPPAASVAEVEVERLKPEGHEQFAIRGVAAGTFVVEERSDASPRFALRLEVEGAMRSWALPKEPSMDPAVKRFAIELDDQPRAEGEVWDRGPYEQGGRVAWPEALERGHAVFVLHGEKLSGGFALQRTRSGEKPQWLLIKRREG